MKRLTKIERDTVLSILHSCENIFEKDDIVNGYTDGGDFVCTLPSKKHVDAIKTAWKKIFLEY